MIIIELIFFALGLTIGYFLIKDAVKKGILEAHEVMGDYHPPVEEKKEEEKSTVVVNKTVGELSKEKSNSRFISNWICPHCETINSSKDIRCVKCGKLPSER